MIGQLTITEMNVLIPIAGLAALTATAYRKTPFDPIFDTVGRSEGVDPDLLRAIARHESGFNPSATSAPNRNGTRDYGIMQINESTARTFGYSGGALVTSASAPDPNVIIRSVTIAARLLKAVTRELGEKSNYYTVIAAYNAGSPAIRARGIFNGAYVGSVSMHHIFYALGSVLRAA